MVVLKAGAKGMFLISFFMDHSYEQSYALFSLIILTEKVEVC